MATETRVPDGLLTQTNLNGSLTSINVDDSTWLTASSNNADSIVIVSFPTPSGNPTGAQNFTVKYRVTANARTVRFDAYLLENGTRINGGTAIDSWTSTSTAGATREVAWNASLLGTADGSLVELEVYATRSGGSPSARTAGEFQFIDWDINYSVPPTALLADDVQSTSEVTTPSLTEIDSNNELLAEDVQSTTEVATTVIGQTHNVLANDVQSLTEVTTSTLGQEHGLLSVFVQSSSELTTPALSEASTVDDLLSEDVQSTSEVSTAVVGQRHELLSTSVSSTTEVTTATLAGTHTLVNASVQSSSELTIPLLSSISSVDSLFANSVQSLSEALTSLLSQDHNLSVISVQSNSTLSSPGQYSQIGTIEGFSSVTIPFSTGRTYYTRNNGYYLISVSSF